MNLKVIFLFPHKLLGNTMLLPFSSIMIELLQLGWLHWTLNCIDSHYSWANSVISAYGMGDLEDQQLFKDVQVV